MAADPLDTTVHVALNLFLRLLIDRTYGPDHDISDLDDEQAAKVEGLAVALLRSDLQSTAVPGYRPRFLDRRGDQNRSRQPAGTEERSRALDELDGIWDETMDAEPSHPDDEGNVSEIVRATREVREEMDNEVTGHRARTA